MVLHLYSCLNSFLSLLLFIMDCAFLFSAFFYERSYCCIYAQLTSLVSLYSLLKPLGSYIHEIGLGMLLHTVRRELSLKLMMRCNRSYVHSFSINSIGQRGCSGWVLPLSATHVLPDKDDDECILRAANVLIQAINKALSPQVRLLIHFPLRMVFRQLCGLLKKKFWV